MKLRNVASVAVALAFSMPIASVTPTIADDAPADEPVASALTAVAPCRLLDTRQAEAQELDGTGSTTVEVAGRCDVPEGANAAALTVTVVGAEGRGFLTVWPSGQERPNASNLNYFRGATVANGALVALGDDGNIDITALAARHVIVDVTAYTMPSSATSAGRFVPLASTRLLDTRNRWRPEPGRSFDVVAPMIPADAIAVAVSLSTPHSSGSGFFTAYQVGAPVPTASVLNTDAAGQFRSTGAIIPVTDRRFRMISSIGDHISVDITGYFTGASAPVTTDGLFVSARPTRLVDTRLPAGPAGGPGLFERGQREFDTESVTGPGVAAIAGNITVTRTHGHGWWLAHPAGVAPTHTSSVVADGVRRTNASMAVTAVSDRGLGIYADQGAHVIVDITGWFLGAPVAATEPVPTNNINTRKVTIISDSAMAGIRWNGALAGLRGFRVDHRLESCRRLVDSSCRGREGYRPVTALSEVHRLPAARPSDVLVVAVGYNDWHANFRSHATAVLNAARARGFQTIAWVTYRDNVFYNLPRDRSFRTANYSFMNQTIRAIEASGAYPELRVWDLNRYTANSSGWFAADGVHETRLGSWGVADWISRHVAHLDGKRCAASDRGPVTLTPCQNPDALGIGERPVDVAQLYRI